MSDTTDLSLVTNEELITELFKRHDAVLIVREQSRVKGSTFTTYDYEGGVTTAIGLAEYAKAGIIDRQLFPEKYDDEDDE